jgi:hypothetical protein
MTPELAEKLVFLFGGLIVGLAGAVFAMSKDTAYIRAQLSEVIRVVEAFKRVAEHVAVLDKAHLKTQIDVAHAHDKLRKLEKKKDPPPSNGESRL